MIRLLLFTLMLVQNANSVEKIGHPRVDFEQTPHEQVQAELDDIVGDTFMQIKGYEAMAPKVARALSDNAKISTDNVVVSVRVFNLTARDSIKNRHADSDLQDVGGQSKSRIHVPLEKIRKTTSGRSAKELTVVSAWWKNTGNFTPQDGALLPENSTILSVSYFFDVGNRADKVSLPVDYYIDLSHDFTEINALASNERLRSVSRACAWLDLGTGSWQRSGCKATFDARGVSCECEHTTTFVTLLLVDSEITMPEEVHAVAMTFEIAGICCLALTVVFICVARQGAGIDATFAPRATGMKANRTNCQVSLCVSLLCMHFVIVWGDVARNNNDHACVAVTFLTHYFLLASAFWSLCEGVGIFIKMFPLLTMKVQYRTMTITQTVVGWIVPLIITISTASYGITHGVYMDQTLAYKEVQIKTNETENSSIQTPQYEECWLSKESNTIWVALGPLILVVAVNLTVLFYVTSGVIKMNKRHPVRDMEYSDTQCGGSSSNSLRRGAPIPERNPSYQNTTGVVTVPVEVAIKQRRHVKRMISVTRSFGILMPILAIPWFLPIFANIETASQVILTAHAVVNGLQGLQIFLLYCVANRRDWKIVKRKWRNSDFRHLFSKYRHNRRDSIAANSARVVTYETKHNSLKVDSNGNAYLHVGWQGAGQMPQYDTLSSCRSSSGTINSTKSLQRNGISSARKSPWWAWSKK